MSTKRRDDFSEKAKRLIAKRAGYLCSYSGCRKFTIGGEINTGTASHICAASPGGPRFDPAMSPEERAAPENGIWMCRDHGQAIDSPDPQFTIEVLQKWKREAEEEAAVRVLGGLKAASPIAVPDGPLAERLRDGAKTDLEVRKRRVGWSPTAVALNVRVGGEKALAGTTETLADAVTLLGDLSISAAPGMGKTTAILQIANRLVTLAEAVPLVVSLGD